jgi:glutaconate CoA-transferase subunit A
MTDQRRSISLSAAAALVPDGSTVYLGNFGAQLFSVGHELLRQGRKDLHIIAGSGGILLDQLIEEGMISQVTVAHCWNPVGPHTANGWRAAVQSGRITVNELSLGALSAGLQAAAWNVPFLPTTDLTATGYVTEGRANGLLDVVVTRFGTAQVVAAIRPDFAFVHATAVDEDGNAWLGQGESDLLAAAMAAHATVVVAEKMVAPSLMSTPATIPGLCVDHVVISPGAVHPDGVADGYPRDTAAYVAYARARTPAARADWRAEVTSAGPRVARA